MEVYNCEVLFAVKNKLEEIADLILDKSKGREGFIVAIDGRCASGKSTLGNFLKERLGCNLIHMDDFFLRPSQRTDDRLSQAGENIDHERFLEEVLMPLKAGEDFSYRPYNCSKQALDEPIEVKKNKITIIEGSYSCNKALWEHYDLRIFIDVDKDTQLERIKLRDGEEYSKVFVSKWIPLEESYFKTFDISNRCDYRFVI